MEETWKDAEEYSEITAKHRDTELNRKQGVCLRDKMSLLSSAIVLIAPKLRIQHCFQEFSVDVECN